eukprot:3054502-Rhodomonas_salina.1
MAAAEYKDTVCNREKASRKEGCGARALRQRNAKRGGAAPVLLLMPNHAPPRPDSDLNESRIRHAGTPSLANLFCAA